MFDQILVPVDGSLLAENILPHVVAIAKAYNSEITLISVLDPLAERKYSRPIDPWDWQIRQAEVEAYLNDLSARLQISGLRVRKVWLEGKVPDQVLHHSIRMGINLIMLSSHGQGGLSDWNSSSVVIKIIQQSRTSVMMIQSISPAEQRAENQLYRRILAPVDGSRRAEYGLVAVAHLAREQGAELLLAHVIKPPELPRKTPLSTQEQTFIRQVVESNWEEATQYLNALKATLDCQVETCILTEDSVAEALHRLAERKSIDLVILNAHGLGANNHRPFGSLTLNFLAYGATALLIVQDYSQDFLSETREEASSSSFRGQPPQIFDEARQDYWEVSQ